MEKWNEICVDLCNCQNRNVSESEYQKQVALDLRLLGWKLYAHEIREQMTIEIGAANALRPDFVIYKDEKPQFVIELKRPQHVQRERERTQLFSYMKQLNLKIGLYIGEDIQVFYFDSAKDENPRLVFCVALKIDSEDGRMFVELFSRENYSQECLLEFCQERMEYLRQQELLAEELKYLTSENGRIWIYDMLRRKYGEEHTADWVEDLLQKIDIIEGETDLALLKEKLWNGNNVILMASYDNSGNLDCADDPQYAGVSVGDTIQFYENGTPTKVFTVVAKAAATDSEITLAGGGSNIATDIGGPMIYMSEDNFKEIYKTPTLYGFLFDVEDEYQQEMENYLAQNTNISFSSVSTLRATILGVKNVVLLIGGMI